MTQYNNLNVKLSNSQLNKLKSGNKNGAKRTLNLPSIVISDSKYETKFPNKLLLTDRQALSLCIAFANISLAKKNLLKIQVSNIKKKKLLGRVLEPFLNIGLSLMKNVPRSLAKRV